MTDSTHTIMLDGDAIFGVDEVAIRVVRRFLSRAYVFGDGGTHWDGCELAHHECAIIKATRLEAENERLRAEVARLRNELDEIRLAYTDIMNEPCEDEVHCTCVPGLRAEIVKWIAANNAATTIINEQQAEIECLRRMIQQ